MSTRFLLVLRALLALAALLGFVYLYGRAILYAASPVAMAQFSEAYIYTATALAGLVGGVASTSLGQGYPGMRAHGHRRAIFQPLGRVLAPLQPEQVQNSLAIVYTTLYVVYGLAALIVWIGAPADRIVPELVRNLGLIFLGLAIATAQSFLGQNPARTVSTHHGKRQSTST